MENSDRVIPLFLINEEQVKTNPYKNERQIYMMEKFLLNLNKETQNKLNVLIVKNDNDMVKNLKKISIENNISSIYFNDDYTLYSKKRDSLIKMTI